VFEFLSPPVDGIASDSMHITTIEPSSSPIHRQPIVLRKPGAPVSTNTIKIADGRRDGRTTLRVHRAALPLYFPPLPATGIIRQVFFAMRLPWRTWSLVATKLDCHGPTVRCAKTPGWRPLGHLEAGPGNERGRKTEEAPKQSRAPKAAAVQTGTRALLRGRPGWRCDDRAQNRSDNRRR